MVAPRARGYLIIVTVFAFGAVAGGTSVFSVLKHRSASMLVDDRADERRLEIMTSRLGLDGAQRERIAGILNDARREAVVITHETDAKCGHPLLDHRAKVDDRIRAELRAPQQTTFDELLARRREREASSPSPP